MSTTPEEYQREYQRAYYAEPGRRREQADKRLQKVYDITIDDYECIAGWQGHVCAICGEPNQPHNKTRQWQRLAVDHDKETGEVRGLLCTNCNVGIGALMHDPARLEAAIRYLHPGLGPGTL